MLPYLVRLTARLSEGLGRLPAKQRTRHAKYLLSAQQPGGGFCGRDGSPDLYYSTFALRALAVLGELQNEPAEQATEFYRQRMTGRETIVDSLSLVYGAKLLEAAAGINVFANAAENWQVAIANSLEQLRRDDGGYAKGPQGIKSSTYHTFLVMVCLELIEQPVPRPENVVQFLLQQQDDEGGFREIQVQKRAGTNPTAAAIGAISILDALDPDTRELTIDFLSEMQTDEGGLRANTRIPIADLLSTFTGLLTLTDLNAIDAIDTDAVLRYVRSLELANGGFHAAVWDEAHDVEYTFYGLGCLALLKEIESVHVSA